MPDTPRAARKARVAAFISGAGTNMAALLYAGRLPETHFEIVLVAANDPEAPGLALAEAEGIETFALAHGGVPRAEHDAAMEAAARNAGAEYIALAGYMRILTPGFVERWEDRILNIHPSLLPAYPGLETHRKAIEAGDPHGGCSVHLVTQELDAGSVLGQAEVAIRESETAESLARRVQFAEHQLYSRVLDEWCARPFRPDWLLEELRRRALALPESEERESHGAPAFKLAGKSGKFFAHFSDRHHGEAHVAVLVKTSGQEELAELVERDPDTFYRPAYYGASGWVGLVLNRKDCDWEQVDYWLERSWRAVAPGRLAAAFDI
ncbi:phosphoribosylglycinamide formyltransferase [Qipengyuania sp. JC766]|uniref:phosphoribosylglycinamide formyltransferase n=1 Tax=Qipengyuania sp. JC766 TaxID=3232139 RepID=UPI00345876E9